MKIKILTLILCIIFLFSGCGKKAANDNGDGENNTESTTSYGNVDFAKDDSEMFTNNDKEVGYDLENSAQITLNGNSATSTSNAVKTEKGKITITDEGTYILKGDLNDAMIVVNADETDKPRLVFDGVNITNNSSAALYILEADKVFVTLADGSENSLSNSGSFTQTDDSNIDGTVFSKQDLTFNGSGKLTVNSLEGHGIVCKDDLVFTSGDYIINSASHGIDANDSVRLSTATIKIEAGKDGIHCENTDDATLGFFYMSSGKADITAQGDGISTSSYAQIEDGTVNIITGGGSENGAKQTSDNYGGFMGGGRGPKMQNQSTTQTTEDSTSIKGIKAENSMLVNGGSITINSADDAVHSNNSVTINGGNFNIATGDDAFHADEKLTVTNGNINITTCYEGLEALNVKVTGGDIKLKATDDGINAAGGTDQSGMGGMRPGGDKFGGGMGGPGGMSSNSNGSIAISGGNLYINSSGDGIDANGTLEISGGYTVVVGPTQGDTATLDYDASGIITGGTFIGTGAGGMAQSFSNSKNQGVVAVSVGNCQAGTKLILTDSSGKEILSHTPELSFAVVILSSPDIEKGKTYTITVGDKSGEFEAS